MTLTKNTRMMEMNVLIDPGHAPGNANAGKNGYREYAGMWKLSNFLKDILTASGICAALTRTEQQDPSLDVRGGMAKGYDLFISQHSNAFNGTARGVECYYSVKKPNDRPIAAKLSAEVAKLMGNPDRGAKTREGNGGADYYGVIRAAITAGCPRVFLIESGFHDNQLDEEFLLKDDNLRRIAEVQARIIVDTIGAKTPIMGASAFTAEQLAAFLLSENPEPSMECTALELARLFVSEGAVEGVRGDIAFCQSIRETGWFRYGGQTLPEQHNYAGIGSISDPQAGTGAWFDSPRIGVRAQIHQLKAHASTEPLKQADASPVSHFVARGTAPFWEDLSGGWAVPGSVYGQSVLKVYEQAKEFAARMTQNDTIPIMDLAAATAVLVEHGIINSPDYWLANHDKLEYLDMLIINMAKKLLSL